MTSNITLQEVKQELYEVIREDKPFEQKACDALELGERYLGVANGHLVRIDSETDHWEAIVSTDPPDGQFPPGLELDLETTYCRRTIESDSPIVLHDAPDQGWTDDPAFETHGLHCYHGTTLVIDGEPYGTICFVDEEPRQEEFRENETMFAELLTRLLERELEREQHEADLMKQTNLATVLNRVLRHNLRNDLSVVRGYTRLMADQLEEDTYGETALDTIDELLALSQKARELDQIVTTDAERESTELVSLIEGIVEELLEAYPSASVTIESPEEITAAVLSSFDRAVEELLENAIKHSGADPSVTVTIETVPNAIELQITDTGPGIPEQEIAVLKAEEETPLVHGSGLGLWLVHWIVTSHSGSVEATTTDDGTTITVTIPRKPATNVQEQLGDLTRARDRYKAAFEEALDAIVITDDEGRFIEVNERASALFGVPKDDLLGRSIAEFAPDTYEFEAVWESFQASDGEQGTIPLVRADGSERIVEYAATPDVIPGEHLSVLRDITEQKQRERRYNAVFS